MKNERIYVGGIEIYREYTGSHAGLERKTLHVMDGNSRIALVETRNEVDDGSPGKLVRYQFSNHLGTVCLETDDNARVVSYEEYHPYGTTSCQAVDQYIRSAAKRYRYTGKERDDETGLYYYGARYYAPWLGRWTSCDPAGIVDGPNLFSFTKNNPICLIDPDGKQTPGIQPPVSTPVMPPPPPPLQSPPQVPQQWPTMDQYKEFARWEAARQATRQAARQAAPRAGAALLAKGGAAEGGAAVAGTVIPITVMLLAIVLPFVVWLKQGEHYRKMADDLNRAREKKIAPGAPSGGPQVDPVPNNATAPVGDPAVAGDARIAPSTPSVERLDFPPATIYGKLTAASNLKTANFPEKKGSTLSYMYIISVFTEEGLMYKPGQTVDPKDRFEKYLDEYGEALYEMEIFKPVSTPNARVGEGLLIGELGAKALNKRKNTLGEMRGGEDYSDVIEKPRYHSLGVFRNPCWRGLE